MREVLEQESEDEWWMRELEQKRGKEGRGEERVEVGVWSVANVCVCMNV